MILRYGTTVLLDQSFDAGPRTHHEFACRLPAGATATDSQLRVDVVDGDGRELVSYAPRRVNRTLPTLAKAIDEPAQLDSNEALYLAGRHLEQYRHATRDPDRYFREGLRRDPGDLRCHVALGQRLFRRGLYRESEKHFRSAVARATCHNPNPEDGGAHYGLGLTLAVQEHWEDAENALHKATWTAAYKAAAFFELARLAVRDGRRVEAETLLKQCIEAQRAPSSGSTPAHGFAD